VVESIRVLLVIQKSLHLSEAKDLLFSLQRLRFNDFFFRLRFGFRLRFPRTFAPAPTTRGDCRMGVSAFVLALTDAALSPESDAHQCRVFLERRRRLPTLAVGGLVAMALTFQGEDANLVEVERKAVFRFGEDGQILRDFLVSILHLVSTTPRQCAGLPRTARCRVGRRYRSCVRAPNPPGCGSAHQHQSSLT